MLLLFFPEVPKFFTQYSYSIAYCFFIILLIYILSMIITPLYWREQGITCADFYLEYALMSSCSPLSLSYTITEIINFYYNHKRIVGFYHVDFNYMFELFCSN